MGYHSYHPLGGDTPSEVSTIITEQIYTEQELYDFEVGNWEQTKKRLEENLPKIVSTFVNVLNVEGIQENEFVLPFFLAEHHIQIEDPELSAKVKGMIADGGATDRGYTVPKEFYEKKELYFKYLEKTSTKDMYGRFESPFEYAKELYLKWDGLMAGTEKFEDLGIQTGLLDEIEIQIQEGLEGLINKK